jgi:hypothetical protein
LRIRVKKGKRVREIYVPEAHRDKGEKMGRRKRIRRMRNRLRIMKRKRKWGYKHIPIPPAFKALAELIAESNRKFVEGMGNLGDAFRKATDSMNGFGEALKKFKEADEAWNEKRTNNVRQVFFRWRDSSGYFRLKTFLKRLTVKKIAQAALDLKKVVKEEGLIPDVNE